MKIAAPPAELTSRLRWLAKHLRRLQPEQGRLARKNAREGVLVQLRGLRRVMDLYFPPLPKNTGLEKLMSTTAPWEKPKPKTPRSPAQLMVVFKRRMNLRQYGPVSDTALALTIAKAGVRLVDAPKRTQVKVQYAPLWAIVAATTGNVSGGNYNLEKVREVRKSVTARRALLAASSLGAQ